MVAIKFYYNSAIQEKHLIAFAILSNLILSSVSYSFVMTADH